jgi:23S rRNA pseudouridine1911/1915/1917 synthase
VLERYAGATLLECSLDTGRTHQIRVHLQSIGHPLVGDPVYRTGRGAAAGPLANFKRQALHAYRLGLVHPVSGAAMQWEAPLPADMQGLLSELAALAA